MARAVTFSQYWKACTNVMLRIPPDSTVTSTTSATSAAPTHVGAPVSVRTTSPAVCSCGIT